MDRNIMRKWTFLSLILTIMLLFVPIRAEAEDRSYTVELYYAQVQILENGDAEVEETVDFNFKGKFNGVLREIVPLENKEVELTDVYYMDGEKKRTIKEDSEDIRYELKETEGSLGIKVFLPSQDETRKVGFRYTIKDAVEKGKTTDSITEDLLGSRWDVVPEKASIEFTFEKGGKKLKDDDIKFSFKNGTTADIEVKDGKIVIDGIHLKKSDLHMTLKFPKGLVK